MGGEHLWSCHYTDPGKAQVSRGRRLPLDRGAMVFGPRILLLMP
jgi:hypothetical protein